MGRSQNRTAWRAKSIVDSTLTYLEEQGSNNNKLTLIERKLDRLRTKISKKDNNEIADETILAVYRYLDEVFKIMGDDPDAAADKSKILTAAKNYERQKRGERRIALKPKVFREFRRWKKEYGFKDDNIALKEMMKRVK